MRSIDSTSTSASPVVPRSSVTVRVATTPVAVEVEAIVPPVPMRRSVASGPPLRRIGARRRRWRAGCELGHVDQQTTTQTFVAIVCVNCAKRLCNGSCNVGHRRRGRRHHGAGAWTPDLADDRH